jgi:hypothetical protein
VAPPDPERPPLDVRELGPDPAPLPATSAQIRGREELSDRLGRQGVLDFNERTNSARVVAKLDGFLTGPSDADAADIALGFVRANPETFGLSAAEIDRLKLVRRYTSGGGITHLVWAQSFDGVVAWGNELLANVTEDGRLINVSGSPVTDLRTRTTEPELSAGEARDRALADAGATGNRPSGDARLVLFTERPGDTHLAWQVTADKDHDEVYEYLVDARDGRLLFRRNTIDHANAQIGAWEYAPDIHLSTGGALPAAAGQRQFKTALFGGDPIQVDDATALKGPYTHVYADKNDDDVPDSEVAATTPATFSWGEPFSRFTGGSVCPVTVPTAAGEFTCTWTGVDDPDNDLNTAQNAAQVYYFINNFHDWLEKEPNIAFNDASGNFEAADGDAVEAQIYDGSDLFDSDHLNNANMGTPPDGSPPRMQMFLFKGSSTTGAPHGNGGDDASVIYHEYGHGLSNRLVTGGTGASTLTTHQSSSMGEGWSDWYAMDYLESQGIEVADTVGDQGEMIMGRYLFANNPNGLRFTPLDCPVDDTPEVECDSGAPAGPGGFTYGDLGNIDIEPEVHADGEIWTQALWDLRQALTPAVARRIITDGMRLSPPAPSFLDMRNAILQADLAAFGGANHRAAIWAVFAARGMGASASADSGNDVTPTEAFDVPGAGTTASGRVTNAATGAGIANAYVYWDANAAPGDFATRTDANGNYSITDVPNASFARVLVAAPGFARGTRENVAAGSGVDFSLGKNWASAGSGAKIASFQGEDYTASGCGPGGLIDSGFVTGWGSSSPGNTLDPGTKAAVIELPTRVDVSTIAIDPTAVCGDGTSASTGQFRVEVSADGTNFSPYATGTFAQADLGKLKGFAGTANGVRFVRFTMLAPLGSTGSGASFMDATELEVYGTESGPPAPPGGSTPPPSGPAPVNPIVDRVAPTPRIALGKRQKLKTALSKGLKFTVSCNEACSFSASATIDAKTAKKLKLLKKKSKAKTFKVASGSLKLGQGERTAKLKFLKKTAAKLKKLKSVKLVMTWTVKDANGNVRKTTTKATLKR